jgi:nitroimidazol reductase NimA-like FMN-containing flavoprotein (pyridoxamine 5'-phosphate oxidase superfamily)
MSRGRFHLLGERGVFMFPEMRRKKQALSQEETIAVLRGGTSGVLAVSGDGNYPYAVPLSYVYHDSRIFFHCAKSGHKLDAIARNPKVSFCVINRDDVVPHEYTTYFRSVIAFGEARILEDEDERRMALAILAEKYSPDDQQGRLQEIDKQLRQVCLVELAIEHMTGKEAIELTRTRDHQDS